MKNFIKGTIPAVLAGALLAGCSSDCINVQYVPGANPSDKIGGSVFDRSVKVSNLYLKQQDNDLFRAQATLTNLTNERQSLRYRVSWMAADGQQQGYYSPWQPVVLYPALSQVVSAISPNKDSSNFAVQVCYVEQS